MVLRASGGPSILREELSDEQIAMDMDDAMRLNNAAGVGIQVFIGGEFETRSVHNMTKLVDAGLRMGIPVMGITAVGKNMVRDAKYFRLACRIIAELGAQYVKTYYVEEASDHRRVMPGADRDGRRQEATGARGADHGLPRRAAGRLRCRHGPQHFPVGGAAGDDRRRRRRRAQEHEAERRFRPVQDAEGKRRHARGVIFRSLRETIVHADPRNIFGQAVRMGEDRSARQRS